MPKFTLLGPSKIPGLTYFFMFTLFTLVAFLPLLADLIQGARDRMGIVFYGFGVVSLMGFFCISYFYMFGNWPTPTDWCSGIMGYTTIAGIVIPYMHISYLLASGLLFALARKKLYLKN
ncbi:hypothetical protein AKJ50_01165 [candidate division MSBL1 archaeon SCGC-AAA382A13]|uniref:Uncharacterized protein n=1 Tax=candidate division MSBL1 archaeon SCGC-AAA382A13 TaxID=1698279 RepID=A0A133VFY3_9EURY|nr:hypothetical protein AKJ50_01165 [candidate division MSBL1 archaeon SCGC-AAA382A13]